MRRAFSYERFSARKQEAGDSIRRQSSLAKAYCDRHGLTLDPSTLADLGVSAFTGDNATGGELAGFLQAVEDGKIPTGSVLIVENIDRLSRLPPHKANKLLERILEAGVSLVTTSPEREYTGENISGFGVWIELQVSMLLAHEESAKKSSRLRAVWGEKRRKLTEQKLTTVAPTWLKVGDDGATWELKEDMAAAIRRVFALALDGHGRGAIAKVMHEEYPEGPRGNGWHLGAISAILRSRTVLGEFQPYTGAPAKNGRKSTRKMAGPSVRGYYPALIREKDFDTVQRLLDARRRAGGRVTGVPNLFSSLLFDARDGKTMVLNASDGLRRVVSSGALRRQPGSVYIGFPYPELENALLEKFSELKTSDILARNGHESRVEELSGKLANVNHKLASVRKRADDAHGDICTFLDMIVDYEREKRELAAELEKARVKKTNSAAETLGETQSLINLLKDAEGEERVALRLKIRSRIRQLVSSAWMLTVARGRIRIAAVQLWFAEGKKHRSYLMLYIPPAKGSSKNGQKGEGVCVPKSLAWIPGADELDLRRREDAAELEARLLAVKLGGTEEK